MEFKVKRNNSFGRNHKSNTVIICNNMINSINDALHYNIKGSKWGVRRYQNYDGTLTELGKARLKAKRERDKRLESDLRRQSISEINKGIRNKRKQIEAHKAYIENPKSKVFDWDERSSKYKKGCIRHWKKEIREHEKSISRSVNELKRREDKNE